MKPEWASLRKDPDSVDLSDDAVDTVTLYVQWLYYKEAQDDVSTSAGTGEEWMSRMSSEKLGKFIKAYIFGEKIMDVRFKNAVMCKFVSASLTLNRIPNGPQIFKLYEATLPGSPMRRLFADMVGCANMNNAVAMTALLNACPREALIDCLLAMNAHRPTIQPRPYTQSISKYLEKEEDQVSGVDTEMWKHS